MMAGHPTTTATLPRLPTSLPVSSLYIATVFSVLYTVYRSQSLLRDVFGEGCMLFLALCNQNISFFNFLKYICLLIQHFFKLCIFYSAKFSPKKNSPQRHVCVLSMAASYSLKNTVLFNMYVINMYNFTLANIYN
jgi:hypothetical protein